MIRVTTTKKPARAGGGEPSARRARLVRLAGELFAEKGFRATTVREIADAAGILSGSLYHHFDSKESIGDEILSAFLDDVLAGYRAAVHDTDDPRAAIEQMVRSSTATLSRHRAALTMLQNDWAYFSAQPRPKSRDLPAEKIAPTERVLRNTIISQWIAQQSKLTVLEELQAARRAA